MPGRHGGGSEDEDAVAVGIGAGSEMANESGVAPTQGEVEGLVKADRKVTVPRGSSVRATRG